MNGLNIRTSDIRELTDNELEAISGGATSRFEINLGIARFGLSINQYGACFNYGFGFGAGYDGAVCTS
jgi:bacteriocin-like protein